MCVINLKMLKGLWKLFGGLCAFLWLFTATAGAQTVTMTGRVSETVALSVPPHSTAETDVNVVNSGNAVRMTLSGTSANSPVIRVPLMVRSNSGFRISASFESQTAQLAQLSVTDVRATGRLVSPAAVNNFEIPQQLDLEGLKGPFVVATGPRVSLGGTLDSPNNALQITLLIRIKPQSTDNWLVHLTFFNQ